MMIRIANRQRRIPLRVETYRTLAEKVLLRLGQPEAEIGLLFFSDRRIRSLNRIYRGMDQPTDVLSFSFLSGKPRGGQKRRSSHARPMPAPAMPGSRPTHPGNLKERITEGPPLFLGDVVISVPTARRQARAQGHSLRREMAWLMIHGILHLLGYDHEKPGEARRMRRKERALLQHLALSV